MLLPVLPMENPKLLSPLTLAFVGDAVYELLVRSRLASSGSQPTNLLHKKAVRQVCAGAQSSVYDCLEPLLNEEEFSVLKRGRNAHSSTVPKNASPLDYRKATGVEALFGYLYLKGELERIEELFARIERGEWEDGEKDDCCTAQSGDSAADGLAL